MVAAGSSQVRIVLPAKSKIKRQIRPHPPVILRKERQVSIAHLRNRHGHHRRGAMNAHRKRNVQIVNHAIAVQVCKAKVRNQDLGSIAKRIDNSVRAVMLKLAAHLERVISKRHGQAVAYLRAIKKRALRQIEIGTVCQIGKNQLASQAQGGISESGVLWIGRNVVIKVVVMERQLIGAARTEDARPRGLNGYESIQRVLPLRPGTERRFRRGTGLRGVSRPIETESSAQAIGLVQMIVNTI